MSSTMYDNHHNQQSTNKYHRMENVKVLRSKVDCPSITERPLLWPLLSSSSHSNHRHSNHHPYQRNISLFPSNTHSVNCKLIRSKSIQSHSSSSSFPFSTTSSSSTSCSTSSSRMSSLSSFRQTVIKNLYLAALTLLVLLLIFNHRIGINCLRISLLDIPSPLVVGESAELTCNYDLEENALYSFKWYKDGIEFYRYVPRDYPQTQFLKIAGINVDVRKSSKKSVFLQNVNLSTRGKYRCEISAEAPSFVTAAKEGALEVNVLPTMGPKISTDRRRYTVGDQIVSNCTSDRSNLEIHLNFTINGEPVSNSIDYGLAYSTQLHPDSLKTAGLSLHFALTPKHFRHGKLKLKCIASLSVYNIKNEANLLITDVNYRPEPVFLSSESQARSEAKDIHTDQSHLNEWKIFSVLFSMYLHRQLQRVFSTN